MPAFDYLESVQEPHIFLTPLTEDYVPGLYELINSNREHLSQFGDTTSQKYPTIEDLKLSVTKPDNPLKERYIILSKGIIAGSINILPVSEQNHLYETGYYLDREFTGQGIMTTAVDLLVGHLLKRPGIEEVFAYTHPDNIASQTVLLNAKFIMLGYTDDEIVRFSRN